jgi:DnaJ-class molecular chaperone
MKKCKKCKGIGQVKETFSIGWLRTSWRWIQCQKCWGKGVK